MNNVEVMDGPSDLIPDPIKIAYRTVAEWYTRSIEWLSLISVHLHQNPSHAIAVFVTANALFLYFINKLALYLEERVESSPRVLDGDEIKFNQILINGCVVGGSVVIFNLSLSKLLNYPLSKSALAAIMTVSIAFRLIFGQLFAESIEEGNEGIIEWDGEGAETPSENEDYAPLI